MMRYVLRISLVMLLGVVTSVAVAWGCALSAFGPRTTRSDFLKTTVGGKEVAYEHARSIGASYVHRWPYTRFARDSQYVPGWITVIHSPKADGPRTLGYHASEITAGWPLRCLHTYIGRDTAFLSDVSSLEISIDTGLRVPMSHSMLDLTGDSVLPYGPYWPGLLANTAIYGGAWWAMLFGPGYFLRWRRRRAGRCVTCGYDLRGSDPSGACPECGRLGDTAAR